MNRHQQFLFEMLKEIRAICDANGITYYVGMGTLLGAVRNEGFLPWDDDLDVLMTYDNWERFKKACETDLPENRYLGSADTSETYAHLLPRYISRDTTAIHQAQSLHDDVAGELIDIFVLDPIADGDEAYDAYLQDLHLYSMLVNYSTVAGYKCELDPERYKAYLKRMHEEGQVSVISEIEGMLASHFDENGTRYAFRWQGATICFERSWFETSSKVLFEGETFTAPGCLSRFLTCYYGEQWYEVPDNVNPAKHATAFSLDFPYTVALDYYQPSFDREELFAQMEQRRIMALEHAPEQNRLTNERCIAKTFVVGKEVARIVERCGAEFERAIAEKDIATLNELLGDYISWQTSPDMIGRNADKWMYRKLNPMMVDVSDRVFEAGLMVLLGLNRVSHAANLISVRRAANLAMSESMLEVEEGIEQFRVCLDCIEKGDYEPGLEIAAELVARYDYVQAYRFAECMLAQKAAGENADARSLARFRGVVDAALKQFPGDGVFEKYSADIMRIEGQADSARVRYLQAAERTRNGIALFDIYKLTQYRPRWLRKPSWAREYGIARDVPMEPDVTGLPSRPEHEPCVAKPDFKSELLVQLLEELADVCIGSGIRCVVTPEVAKAVYLGCRLPEEEQCYGIVCHPDDMPKLADAIGKSLPKNRLMESVEQGTSGGIGKIVYYARNSMKLDFDAKKKPKRPLMRIEVRTLMPKEGLKLPAAKPFARKTQLSDMLGKLFKRPPREGLSSYVATVATSRGACDFDMAFLNSITFSVIENRRLPVPVDTERYLSVFGQLDDTTIEPKSKNVLESGVASFAELVKETSFSKDYWKRFHAYRAATAEARAIRKRFLQNFDEIQRAVSLKQVSRDLVARKDQILQLSEVGDAKALKALFSDYTAWCKKYPSAERVCFDEEICAVYRDMTA